LNTTLETFLSDNHLQQILSASPNLEDLKVKNVHGDYETMEEFKRLPNLPETCYW